ncbi:MAG: hypothetical protein HQL28_00215 [Candidatus Omnitrophica bacterium]|nr:hypothetical protein [Candidatus Omnitrophota bacterium]
MKNLICFVGLVTVLAFFSGCADMTIPGPKQILKNPIGTSAAKVGMSKSEVVHVFGEPNFKSVVIAAGAWDGEREEWYYKAMTTALPVGADYFSEDMYLYFDGDSLTNISNKPLGKQKN